MAGLPAEPSARTIDFSEDLTERHWWLTEGAPASAGVAGGNLLLGGRGGDETTLRYRFYPLRDGGNRPEFGDFKVQATVRRDAEAGGMAIGLADAGDWRLWLEFDQTGARARLRTEAAGRSSAGEESVVVGQWQGALAPIVDFVLRVKPSDQSRQQITAFAIEPLPAGTVVFEVLPRPGQPLPGDVDLERFSHLGGPFLGGYLWPRGGDAELELRLASVRPEPLRGSIEVRVTDWQDVEVASRQVPVALVAGAMETLAVPLPGDRFADRLDYPLKTPKSQFFLAAGFRQ